MRIKPRQRMWKGHPQQKPYKVQVAPEGEAPVVLDGSLTQKAVVPKWVYAAAGIAVLALLLWFLVLRPIVHNDAVNANKAALAAQVAKTNALSSQLAATQAANQANAAALAKLAGKKPAPTTTTATTTTTVPKTTTTVAKSTATTQPPPVTGPNDGRIEVIVAPGTTASNAITLASKSTLQITDLVIQNVAGGAGRARVQRIAPGQAPQDLLVENLGTLTDQEFRFTTPIVFTSAQQLVLSVDCQANQPACDVGIYFTGPLTQPVTDTTTTAP